MLRKKYGSPFLRGEARSRSAATAPSIAQTTLASPGLTPSNCHVKPRYFTRVALPGLPSSAPSPAPVVSRLASFRRPTTIIPPQCHVHDTRVSRRVASMKFRRGYIGGASPFGSYSISFMVLSSWRDHRGLWLTLVGTATPGVAAPTG